MKFKQKPIASAVTLALMSAAFLAGFLVERKAFALNNLAAAATLILSWNTNELFSVGFQLSFSVVAAIILVADPAYRFLRRLENRVQMLADALDVGGL